MHLSDDDDLDNNCWKPNQEDNGFFEFLQDSSIHGLKYIGQSKQPKFVRIFWTICVCMAVVLSVYMIKIGVIDPFYANPIIIAFQEEDVTVDQIPFPAFSICPSSKMKLEEFKKLADETEALKWELLKKKTPDTPEVDDYWNRIYALDYLLNLCKDSESFSELLNGRQNRTDIRILDKQFEEKDIQGTVVGKYIRPALHNCNETVLLCLWANKRVNCSEMFQAISTEFGHCCVFGMMPQIMLRKLDTSRRNLSFLSNAKLLKKWGRWDIDKDLIIKDTRSSSSTNDNKVFEDDIPRRQRKAGMGSGLSILINPSLSDKDYQCRSMDGVGFRAQVHPLIDYPHIADFGKTIAPGAETFFSVQAQVTVADEGVESVEQEKRQCYFLGEHNLTNFNIYTQQNCIDECLMNQIRWKCRCIKSYMLRSNSSIRVCLKPEEHECVRSVKRNMSRNGIKKVCEKCWPSCTRVEYFGDVTSLPLRDDVQLWINSTGHVPGWASNDLAVVHVFFSKETVEAKTRKILYGFRDILASAGGLLGLTLGFSMLSAIEPIYFATLRLFCKTKKRTKESSTINKTKTGPLKIRTVKVKPITEAQKKTIKKIAQNNRNRREVIFGYPRDWFQD